MFHSFSFKFLIHFVSGGLPVSPVTIWMWLKSRKKRKTEKRKGNEEVKGELHDQWEHPLSNAIHAFPFLPRLLLYLSIKDHEHCWIKLFTHCLQIYQRLSLFKCAFIVGEKKSKTGVTFPFEGFYVLTQHKAFYFLESNNFKWSRHSWYSYE